MNEGEVVGGELVIERGAAPTLLNLVEELLHQISGATEEAAEADWLGPVPLSGAVCPRAHGPVGATIELSAVSERGRYEGAEDATIQGLCRLPLPHPHTSPTTSYTLRFNALSRDPRPISCCHMLPRAFWWRKKTDHFRGSVARRLRLCCMLLLVLHTGMLRRAILILPSNLERPVL